jgi:hypothetical protein
MLSYHFQFNQDFALISRFQIRNAQSVVKVLEFSLLHLIIVGESVHFNLHNPINEEDISFLPNSFAQILKRKMLCHLEQHLRELHFCIDL